MKKINTLFRLFFTVALCILPITAYAERECNPFSKYLADGSGDNFLLLEAFEIIRDVFSSLATFSWDTFSPGLKAVVIVGISIYLAVYTLKNVGSFSQQDVSAYLSGKNGVIPILFKGALIVLLLSNEGFVYGYLVSPIISVGSTISGNNVLGEFDNASSVSSLFDAVIKQAKEFNDRAYQIVAIGRMLLCLAFLPSSIFDWLLKMVPFGAALYIFGWMIIIGIAFYMLDILFRLGVACVVLPLAIACGMSKLTSSYTQKTWGLFVNIAFNFVLLGMIIDFTLKMVMAAIEGALANSLKELVVDQAARVLNDSDAEHIEEALTIGGFIILAISCLISFKLFSNVEQLAEKLSNSAGVGKMNQKMGAEALQKVKNVASAPVKAASGVTKEAVKDVGDQIMDSKAATSVRRGWNSAKDAVKNAFNVKDIS